MEGILLLLLAVPESEAVRSQPTKKKQNTGEVEREGREKGKVRA
jgi:hypothetical protein